MQIKFNTYGNEKQLATSKLWVNNSTTDIAYGGSKGSGKSFLGCSLIFGDALIYPETHYFIARKKLNDLRKYTVPSINEVFQGWGLDKRYYNYNGNDNFFELYNGSKVFLLDAKYLPSDPLYQRFGSMQMTRGWIEEAGEFELEAKNNLNASIGRWKNEEYGMTPKLFQTCNPAKNYLYKDYYKKNKEGTLEEWKAFIQALPQDNKRLDKGYLENLNRILSKNEKERLLFGNWEYDDDPLKLFQDYDKILDIFTNDFIKPTGQKYITADIAYEGSDIFVIGVWNGWVLEKIYAFDKMDDTQISKTIHDIRIKEGVPISNVAYDADGLKTFVRQSTKTGNLTGAIAFNNGSSALGKENYYNLKAQCYFYLADKVNKAEMLIRDKTYSKQIIEELEQIKQIHRVDDNKPFRLESKDDLRLRLRRSPDFADMLMMRVIFDLRGRTIGETKKTLAQLGINY